MKAQSATRQAAKRGGRGSEADADAGQPRLNPIAACLRLKAGQDNVFDFLVAVGLSFIVPSVLDFLYGLDGLLAKDLQRCIRLRAPIARGLAGTAFPQVRRSLSASWSPGKRKATPCCQVRQSSTKFGMSCWLHRPFASNQRWQLCEQQQQQQQQPATNHPGPPAAV